MNHLQLFADTFGWARDVTAPSRRRLGWVYGFEGKCLKEGLRNGAEASLPVRLAHRLRRRPVYRRGRLRLSAHSVRRGGQVGRARRCMAWQRIAWFKKPAADFPARA